MVRLFHGLAACLLLGLLLGGVGCGGRAKGTVSGKITVNGKPLSRGLITFLSQVGTKDPHNAAIINGEYKTDPIPVGPAKILVVPALRTPSEQPPEEAKGGDRLPRSRPTAKTADAVPEKYQSGNTSPLEMTIKPGENDFSKDLAP
jgi:hypothetical protein